MILVNNKLNQLAFNKQVDSAHLQNLNDSLSFKNAAISHFMRLCF